MTRKIQFASLILLLALGSLVQSLVVARAVVPALDAVRFIHWAQSIDDAGFVQFLRTCPEEPVFPALIWAFHSVMTLCWGTFPQAWAVSAQLAAALPVILLPIPIFSLAKEFVAPRLALLGAILCVSLPEFVRLGADGISDSTHLLLFTVAVYLLVRHLMPSGAVGPRAARFVTPVLAGTATGLAILTRSEALLLVPSLGLVLGIRWLRRDGSTLQIAAAYAGGLAVVLAPYGVLASSPGADGSSVSGPAPMDAAGTVVQLTVASDESLSFASKDPTTSIRRRGLWAATRQLAEELADAFAYAPGLLALAGLWVLSRRKCTDADLLLRLFCSLFLGAVWFHASREGYLAARHLLPVAVAAVGCLGAGAETVAVRIRRAFAHPAPSAIHAHRWSLALTALVVAGCLLQASEPLHASRLAHRQAGEWLLANGLRGDRVVDTRGWTGLYSGMSTIPYAECQTELPLATLRYIVVEDRELTLDSRRSRSLNALLERAGTRVAAFPAPTAHREAAGVLVYRWDASRLQELPEKHGLAADAVKPNLADVGLAVSAAY